MCSQGARLDLEIFDGLASLTEKSLLRQKEDPDGEPRFRMLETIREYALEHLTNQPDAYDLHQAYARYYLQFALEAETGMVGECVSEWLDRLDDESSNLTAALTWSAKNNPLLELQLVNALARFWILRGAAPDRGCLARGGAEERRQRSEQGTERHTPVGGLFQEHAWRSCGHRNTEPRVARVRANNRGPRE